MIATDTSKWGDGITAEQYFSPIKNRSYLNTEHIMVHNYFHNGYSVGQAYYDVANNRIIFTNSSNENYHSAILGEVDGQYAYFYSSKIPMIWRVNIENGNLSATYDNSTIMGSTSKVIDLWKENGNILTKMSHQKNNLEIIIKYRIIGYELEVLSVSNNRQLLDKLALTETNNVTDDIKSIRALLGVNSQTLLPPSGINHDVHIRNSKLIIIDGKDSGDINRRYWLRVDSNTLIKPNLEVSYYTYISHEGDIMQWTPPNDLILVGSLLDNNGMEIFFFYSKYEDKIYRQEGLGQDILDNGNSTAKIIHGLNEIESMTTLHGNIIIINKQGQIRQLNNDGSTQLVGVNSKWLNNQEDNSSWWSRLNSNYKEIGSLITILGLKNGGEKVPAWYFKGEIIIGHTL